MTLSLAPSLDVEAPAAPLALGYARISKDDAQLGLGVERQTEDITRIVEREGWPLACPVITDNDRSASRYATKRREGFAEVVSILSAGAVNRLVIYNLDRLLRQPRELEDLIDLVEALPDLMVVTVSGILNLRSREGRMFARMQITMAANEADATHDRIVRHLDQLAAMGRPKGVGRARAFGYESDGVTIVPEEAAAFRKAVADVLAGASLMDVVREWNAAGYRTPQAGKAFRSQTVKDILTNPRHAGYYVRNGKVARAGGKPVRGVWSPLVSDADHEALKAKLNDPSRRQGPRGARGPFSGLLRNVEGRALEFDTSGGRRRYGTRPHYSGEPYLSVSIGADFVEARVLELFFEAVDTGRLAERVAARRTVPKVATTEDPAAIERELETLAKMKGAGEIEFGEWQAMRAPLKARLEAARKAAQVDVSALGDRVLDDLDDLRERWESFTPDRQRAYLSAAFECVTIHRAFPDKPGRLAAGDTRRIEPMWRV